MPKYTVTIETDPIEGSAMAKAEYQGWGASCLLGYLQAKMPAGSPVKIVKAEHVRQNFHTAAQAESQS